MEKTPGPILDLLQTDPEQLPEERIFFGQPGHIRETADRLYPPGYIELTQRSHIMPEICCILEGSQGMMWGGRYFHFQAGDIAVIPRMVTHYEKNIDRTVMYRNLWIGFQSMTRITLTLCRYDAGSYAIEDSFHLTAPDDVWAGKFSAIAPAGGSCTLKADLHRFWTFLHGRITAGDFFWNRRSSKEAGWRSRALVRARRYIDNNVTRKLTLKEIAGQIKISPAYFSSLFKKEYGETVFDHIIWERLRHAVKLLRETDLTITEIAHTLQYTDVYYFSRIFKRNYGITPTRFRNQYL